MIKGDTQNFYVTDLDCMEKYPPARAITIGQKVPYHLQYVRDGNVNIKPDKKSEVKK